MSNLESLRRQLSRLPQDDFCALLAEILAIATQITSADKRNIQLVDPLTNSLRIVAHHGFGRPFLEHSTRVHHREAACGSTLQSLERVIVEDITKSPIFIGTEALQVFLDPAFEPYSPPRSSPRKAISSASFRRITERRAGLIGRN